MQENLYIKVVDGSPVDHPVTESNLRMFYPDLDPNNPPEGFERFIRNATPAVGPFDVYHGTEYRKIDGVFQDYHVTTPMSPVEKENKITLMRQEFPFANTWTLNETTGVWSPPKPSPDIPNKNFYWSDDAMDWIEFNPIQTQGQ